MGTEGLLLSLADNTTSASPRSCWKQVVLLSPSSGCRRTPLLGLGRSYSRSGSMACSLSPARSGRGGSDCGNPNIGRDEKKSKAPQSRKPPHHAPIHRGSSGVMSSLPVGGANTSQAAGRGRQRCEGSRGPQGGCRGLCWLMRGTRHKVGAHSAPHGCSM